MGWPYKIAAGLSGSFSVMLLSPFMLFCSVQTTNGDRMKSNSTGEQEALNLHLLPGLNFCLMSVFYKEIQIHITAVLRAIFSPYDVKIACNESLFKAMELIFYNNC